MKTTEIYGKKKFKPFFNGILYPPSFIPAYIYIERKRMMIISSEEPLVFYKTLTSRTPDPKSYRIEMKQHKKDWDK